MRTDYAKGRTVYVKEDDWALVKDYCRKNHLSICYFIGDLIRTFLAEQQGL